MAESKIILQKDFILIHWKEAGREVNFISVQKILFPFLQLVETQENYRFTQLISGHAGSRSLSHVPVDLKQIPSPFIK